MSSMVGLVAAVIIRRGNVPLLVVAFVAFSIFYLCMKSSEKVMSWFKLMPEGRRRAISFLVLGTVVLLVLRLWEAAAGPYLSSWLVSDDEIRHLVEAYSWISYDPLEFNPTTGNLPQVESLSKEIGWIASAGFDGVITFTSSEPMDEIVSIAHERGLLVIMGIWNPASREETRRAEAKCDIVAGYVVGHNGLHQEYSWSTLRSAIEQLRFRTRRPVTTTERIDDYLYDKKLAEVGDWIFPDAHLSLRTGDDGPEFMSFSADPYRDVQRLVLHAQAVAGVGRQQRKPVLLKMVTYPAGGVGGATPEQQAKFFSLLLENRRDIQAGFPADVSIAPHGAFDARWKTRWPFYPWESNTGIIEDDGTFRPAVRVLRERLP